MHDLTSLITYVVLGLIGIILLGAMIWLAITSWVEREPSSPTRRRVSVPETLPAPPPPVDPRYPEFIRDVIVDLRSHYADLCRRVGDQSRAANDAFEVRLNQLDSSVALIPLLRERLKELQGNLDHVKGRLESLESVTNHFEEESRRIAANDARRGEPMTPILEEIASEELRKKICGVFQAIDLLDRGERFDQSFKTLSVEIGYTFCVAVRELEQGSQDAILHRIHGWLNDRGIRYSYVLPHRGESFDPKMHESANGLSRAECAGRNIVRVICWGIRREEPTATPLITPARVQIS